MASLKIGNGLSYAQKLQTQVALGTAGLGASAAVTPGANASVALTGLGVTGSVGTTTNIGKASISVTGVSGSASAGTSTTTVAGTLNQSVTGVTATGNRGTVTTVGKARALPTGLAATGGTTTPTITVVVDQSAETITTYTVSSAQPGYTGYSGTGAGMRNGVFSGAVGSDIWGSASAGTALAPQWIMADLGGSYVISRVEVWPLTNGTAGGFNASHTNGSLVQVSVDGSTWTDIGILTGAADNVAAVLGVHATGRYVRLYSTSNYVAAGDFRIYGTSAGAAVPLTWNSADKEAAIVLSLGDLKATNSGSDHNATVRAETSITAGKWHWETTVGTPLNSNASPAGIATSLASLSTYLGDQDDSLGWYDDGSIYVNENIIATVAGFVAGSRLAVEYDGDAKLIWLAVGAGNWNNSGTANPATGVGGISTAGITGSTVFPAATLYGIADNVTLHSDAATFTRAVSSGFAPYAQVSPPAPTGLFWDTTNQGQSNLDLTGYTLDFEEQFTDSSKLYSEQYSIAGDGGNYIAPMGSWFAPAHADFGAARFIDPNVPTAIADPAKTSSVNPFSYTYEPGSLTITMEKVGGVWQTGHCQTTDWRYQGYTFNKGYVEMRARFDNTDGTWYSIWLISQVYTTGGTISERIEYDIVEAYGKDPGHHNTLHLNATGQDPVHVGDYTGTAGLGGNMFDGQYHTYGALITDTHLITYWDGKELARMDISSRSEFSRAEHGILLSLAGNPDILPTLGAGQNRMVISHVKVWLPPA